MSKRTMAGAAALVAAAGCGAFAATVIGGGEPAHQRAVNAGAAEMVLRDGTKPRAATGPLARRGKRKPVVTHLITRDPTDAPDGSNPFIAMACPKGTGQPIGGGVITSGAPGLAADVISRFNPNTGAAPRNRYFVGVSNASGGDGQFFGTLVCGKGMRVR